MKGRWSVGLAAVALTVVAAALPGRLGGSEAGSEARPWTFAQSMSQRRSYVAAAEVGGMIYVAGGMVGESGRPLHVFQRYDPGADTWKTLRRMPEPVRAAAGAAVDGTMYVVGGSTPDGPTADVHGYDIARGVWEPGAPLPEPRLNHQAVAVGGEVYVLGGLDENARETDDVFVYDPEADEWREAAPLPRPLHAFGALAFRDEIWVLGGQRSERILRDVWIFDPRSGRWRRGPTMPEPMELLGTAAAGDEIHAVWESTYQIYDAETGTWRSGPRSLVTRHGLQAFVVDRRLYTIGGCTTALVDSQVVEARELGTS